MIEKLGITPGPWDRDDYQIFGYRNWKNAHKKPNMCINVHHGKSVKDNDITQIHNALLTAAAPEMLESIILYCLGAEYTAALNNIKSTEMIQFDAFIKIIEKATGRTWAEVKELIDERTE